MNHVLRAAIALRLVLAIVVIPYGTSLLFRERVYYACVDKASRTASDEARARGEEFKTVWREKVERCNDKAWYLLPFELRWMDAKDWFEPVDVKR